MNPLHLRIYKDMLVKSPNELLVELERVESGTAGYYP